MSEALQLRRKVMLDALRGNAALEAAVKSQVDEFFRLNPDEPRTTWAEVIVTVAVFEAITNGQEEAKAA